MAAGGETRMATSSRSGCGHSNHFGVCEPAGALPRLDVHNERDGRIDVNIGDGGTDTLRR